MGYFLGIIYKPNTHSLDVISLYDQSQCETFFVSFVSDKKKEKAKKKKSENDVGICETMHGSWGNLRFVAVSI